jgi:phage gpG-like protein
MDARNIDKIVGKLKDEVVREVTDRLPRKVGVIAVNQFKQNFRESGFMDGGLHPWKRTRRQDGKGTDSRYGPLTSTRNHLMSSVEAHPEPGQVTIDTPVPYAAIHNEGGDITTHPSVTGRMRKYAWHKVYSLAGIRGKGKLPKELPPEAQKWKGLALTPKSRITVHAHIPQRKFIGDSAELRGKINNTISQSIERIKDGIARLSAH